MWMDIGWGLYFQVVGTHKHYMSSSKFFLPLVVGTLKPSITFILLPLLPAHPLAPCPHRGGGDPKNSITYPYPPLAIGSEGSKLGVREASWEQWEQAGSKGSELAVSLAPNRGGGHPKLGPTGVGDPKRYSSVSIMPYLRLVYWEWGAPKTCPHKWWGPQKIQLNLHYALSAQSIGSEGRDPWPNRGSGHPKTCCHRWWTPQNIPLNLHYNLHLLSTLEVRGVSWEQAFSQQRWWAPQNVPPHVVGTPKHTPQSPLPPTSVRSIGSDRSEMGVRGVSWERGERAGS